MQFRRNHNTPCPSESSQMKTSCGPATIVYKARDVITTAQQSD